MIPVPSKIVPAARCYQKLSATLVVLLSALFGAQAQVSYPFVETSPIPFSLLKSELADDVYHFAVFRKGDSTQKNLATLPGVMRVLSDTTAIVSGVAQQDSVQYRCVFAVNDLWKFSRTIFQSTPEKSGAKKYTLKLRQVRALEDVKKKWGQIKICDVRNSIVLVECSYNDILRYVISDPEVIYVGLEEQRAIPESRVLDNYLAPNRISYVHHAFPSLTGDGLVASIKEDKYDALDIDLAGRHLESSLASALQSNHATEMATLLGGVGNSFVTGRGVASQVTLTSSNFDLLGPDPAQSYVDLDVGVQNHSYGTVVESFYGALAESFDAHVDENPTVLHVFSSGNDGAVTPSTGTYAGVQGYANLTGNFKMAKNAFVVGSVDTVGRTLSFASKGPAYDGRVKPELVTYSSAGTSNSAALVSGVAILLQQEYKNQHGVLPSSALLKALLINGARDAGLPGIDYATGYGSLDAYRSLAMLQAQQHVSGELMQGETHQFTISPPPGARNLTITLTWVDPAGAIDAPQALVNDLDLEVLDPTAASVRPWKLNEAASGLTQPAVRGVDRLNNVEQVSVSSTVNGDYTIVVSGFSIPSGSRQFYVAYRWDIPETFTWLYPTGSDNFPYNGEAGTYFLWSSTLNTTTGSLEYSIDEGQTWSTIKASVELSREYQRWDAPAHDGPAMARMVTSSGTYYSEEFTISRPARTYVGFNCTDSVMLTWDVIPNAVTYHVRSFDAGAMTSVTTGADTSLVIRKSDSPSPIYSVQPVFAGNKSGIQGYAFDYNAQGVSCYIASFFVTPVRYEGLTLTLQLGTTLHVSRVIFEKWEGNETSVVADVNTLLSTSVEVTDHTPTNGFNEYRVRVLFDNGAEITSETVGEYFLTTSLFLVYPNPIRSGEELQLIAKLFEDPVTHFTLYSSGGLELFSWVISADRESIVLPELSSGLYLYTIRTEAGVHRGRVVVTN